MIDLSKKYTCGGKRVIGLKIELNVTFADGTEHPVTYPVKGSVVVREKPLRLAYRIWSIEGKADVVWGKGHNLVEEIP
jgi:hypothetical protein